MLRASADVKTSDCYQPSRSLGRFLKEWLQYQQEEAKATEAGKELTVEVKKHGRYLQKEKVRILNEIIFPSMANVLYFLEEVAKSRELKEGFDQDIKELLGLQYTAEKTAEGYYYPETAKGYRPAIQRLVGAMLKWDYNRTGEEPNFRLEALATIQHELSNELSSLATFQLSLDASAKLVTRDLSSVDAWAQLISKQYRPNYGEPSRRIRF
jgi:hypothetical protein